VPELLHSFFVRTPAAQQSTRDDEIGCPGVGERELLRNVGHSCPRVKDVRHAVRAQTDEIRGIEGFRIVDAPCCRPSGSMQKSIPPPAPDASTNRLVWRLAETKYRLES
jgi:hypothetical protein